MHDKTALTPEGPISAHQVSPFGSRGKSVLATAAILVLLGAPLTANALALGAIQVKSALGEPLRAEVEVPEISSNEASSFQAVLGTPQEFQAAGVDYNPALRGARITLSRRPNGQAYLRVEGQQPVNEPFLGIVIDANWADGHVVRDYTLLIDPPRAQAAPSAPAQSLPQTSAPPAPPPQRSAGSGSGAASGAASSGQGEQVSVQRGDTAASIAQAHAVDGVSLDQMLVAMLRSNPQAFIRGNVNLIRAGSVVNMPTADQASAVSPTAARRTVVAQSRNFQAYRQGLAGTAARGSTIGSGKRRSATGRVQAQVQDSGAAPTPQDRLTLSHGKGKSGNAATRRAETRAAQTRQAQEQAAREAELNRNINELSQLAAASNSASAGTATTTAPASQLPAPTINMPQPVPVNAASTPDTSASAPGATQQAASVPDTAAASATATATASAASATASSPRPARHVEPPPPEPSIWDTVQDNLGYIGGLVLALLALGGGYYTYRNRHKSKKTVRPDSSAFSESKFSPDSFFGNSGGQRIDTRESTSDANSSMTYSPSQLEAAGDVDPISEADVYLAYGRDAQAEEILKEALRTYPGRASIYAKLAEIYAKRHDSHLLGALATEAYRVTRGKGHEWQVIANLGRELDPGNTLYQSSGAPVPSAAGPQSGFGADTEMQEPKDFHAPASRGASPEPTRTEPVLSSAPTQPSPFQSTGPGGLARGSVNYAQTAPATGPAPLRAETVNFAPPVPTAKPASSSGMMEFDLNSMPAGLNAKSGGSSNASKPSAAPISDDPMATKLALAQEFHAIGDNEGARKLAREVAAEASGTLKIQAVRLLTELG